MKIEIIDREDNKKAFELNVRSGGMLITMLKDKIESSINKVPDGPRFSPNKFAIIQMPYNNGKLIVKQIYTDNGYLKIPAMFIGRNNIQVNNNELKVRVIRDTKSVAFDGNVETANSIRAKSRSGCLRQVGKNSDLYVLYSDNYNVVVISNNRNDNTNLEFWGWFNDTCNQD